jgi:hypothetical protein
MSSEGEEGPFLSSQKKWLVELVLVLLLVDLASIRLETHEIRDVAGHLLLWGERSEAEVNRAGLASSFGQRLKSPPESKVAYWPTLGPGIDVLLLLVMN